MRFLECVCVCALLCVYVCVSVCVNIVSVAVTLNGMTTFVSSTQRASYAVVNTQTFHMKKIDTV